jgi:hypothetical protein
VITEAVSIFLCPILKLGIGETGLLFHSISQNQGFWIITLERPRKLESKSKQGNNIHEKRSENHLHGFNILFLIIDVRRTLWLLNFPPFSGKTPII